MCIHRVLPIGETHCRTYLHGREHGIERRSFLTQSAGFSMLGLVGAWTSIAAQASPSEVSTVGEIAGRFQFRIDLTVEGNLHLPKNALVSRDLAIQLPIKSQASFNFVEYKIPSLNTDKSNQIRFIRHYETANATTHIHEKISEFKLPNLPNGITVIPNDNEEIIFANDFYLSREELDLLKLPVATSQIDKLLPEDLKVLQLQDSYQLDPAALASAFQLTTIGSSAVKGEVQKRDQDRTTIQIEGELKGTTGATKTGLELVGKLNFDPNLKTCTWLALGLLEKRDISLSEPGFELAATLKIQKTPVETEPTLPITLPQIADQIPASKLQLSQRSEHLRFELKTSRNWHMVTDAPGITTLRLIDHNLVIAQCDFRAPPSLVPGKKYAIEEFQTEIAQKLGEQLSEMVEIDIQTGSDGTEIFRVVANGQAQGIPIRWVFLHFSSMSGRRLSATFTMESGMLERFSNSDTKIASSLTFTSRNPDNSAPKRIENRQKTEAG